MRFEGIVYKPTGNEPKEMDSFFTHYGLVNRFLQTFNTTKLTTNDNVGNFSGKVSILHGVETNIFHNLQYVPKTVQANGRVEFIQIINSTVAKIRIKCKLLTVQIIEPTPGKLMDKIQVSDVTFFKNTDSINVGNKVVKLKGIDGKTLLIDGNVSYDKTVNTVSLAVELATVFVI